MPAKNRTRQSRPAPPQKAAAPAPGPQQPASRATRLVKRRGRAQAGSSDDEIRREALSDGSDGGQSDSDSDSDHPAIQAPPTPVSPHRPPKPAPSATANASWADDPVQIDTAKVASSTAKPSVGAWASAGNDWSVDNDAKLPVVDFEDFNAGRTAPLSPPSNATTPPQDDQPKDSGHRTLRQAYMDRLNSDPSFVPFVGSFYGHDDRFMDLPFRKMNRWAQRGANFRGRGGFRGGFAAAHNVPAAAAADDSELPPTERTTWKHDGYEELSRLEDRRQAARGRGAFRGGRGRGAFRGGFVQQSAPAPAPAAEHPPREPEPIPAAAQPKPAPEAKTTAAPPHKSERRVWFTEKPERTWTRQTDNYLFNDTQPRPPRTEVTTNPVRIKLPGASEVNIVKVPAPRRGTSSNTANKSTALTALSAGHIVIKLGPAATSHASKPVEEAAAPALPVPEPEPVPAAQLRPEVAPYEPQGHAGPFGPLPSATTAEGDWAVRPNPPHLEGQNPVVAPGPMTGSYQQQQQQQFAPSMPYAQQPQPAEHPPYGMVSSGHGSPMYPSPSGYEYAPLPSAYDQHGRPMYFSGPSMPGRGHGHHPSMSMSMSMPPPPPMMYGPPPAQQMHSRHESMQFVPPQQPAEYFIQQQQQPGPPPVSMQPQFAQVVDPESGRPFFKPARATVRIQIRAPGSGPTAEASAAPQQALVSPPATEPRAPAQPVSAPAPSHGPVEFVPQHQHHPSMSMSAHNPYAAPQQQQHGGAHYYYPPQMDGYAYGPGPIQQQQQQMGYTQQQQQPAYGEYYMPQPDGTVYYH